MKRAPTRVGAFHGGSGVDAELCAGAGGGGQETLPSNLNGGGTLGGMGLLLLEAPRTGGGADGGMGTFTHL